VSGCDHRGLAGMPSAERLGGFDQVVNGIAVGYIERFRCYACGRPLPPQRTSYRAGEIVNGLATFLLWAMIG
jgi:hypothetical protein